MNLILLKYIRNTFTSQLKYNTLFSLWTPQIPHTIGIDRLKTRSQSFSLIDPISFDRIYALGIDHKPVGNALKFHIRYD